MKYKYIDKIGIELEGGWREIPPAGKPYYDGSIEGIDAPIIGEIASPPIPAEKISELEKWLRQNYPHRVNNTCGFHIHISLRNLLFYSQLLTPEFHQFLLQELHKWGEENEIPSSHYFWKRLNGARYTRKEWRAEEQIFATEKTTSRYCQLNFCFRLHKTVECRIFPQFEKKKWAILALKKYIWIVEEWLRNCPPEQSEEVIIEGEAENEIENEIFEIENNKEEIKEEIEI